MIYGSRYLVEDGPIPPEEKQISKGVMENDSRPEVIDVINNKIYFYTDIRRENILRLSKILIELDNKHTYEKTINGELENRKIYLHINSYGGIIFDGLAAMDQIKMCKSPVITVVDGICASAATFLSIVGTERLMKRNSFMLIHQLSSFMWGRYDEFVDEMKNLKILMDIIKKLYEEHTDIPKNKLDELLKHDLYFDSKTCLKYGLIDRILE